MEVDRISQFLRNLTFRQRFGSFPSPFRCMCLRNDANSPHGRCAMHRTTSAGTTTSPFTWQALLRPSPSALLIRGLPYRWLIWVFFAFIFTPAVFFNRALSCRRNSDLWCVLPRFANGADGLSAVVLFSEPTGLS